MKGQVFTVAKFHYVNGIMYEVAYRNTTNFQVLADLSDQTTKSGKATPRSSDPKIKTVTSNFIL